MVHAAHQPRARSIALPAEHGSWGLVLEPIVLGLLVAPSLAGLCLAIAAFTAFLLRRPLKVRLAERARANSPRAALANRFLLLYGAGGLAALAAEISLAGWHPLLPSLIASPLLAVFLAYDLVNRSRNWQPELAGTVLFATVASSIALAGGFSIRPAIALAVVLVARAVPSVLYVRTRIRLDRKSGGSPILPIAAHAAGLVAVAALARAGLLPTLAVAAFVVLFIRAAGGLSRWRRRVPVKSIGFTEMKLGIFTLLCVAIGYWAGI